MAQFEKEAGVLKVLLERFEAQRLPRLLDIKKKVYGGKPLNDWDIEFLDNALTDAQQAKSLIEKHPEYEELVSRAIHLYKEITEKALENEKAL